MSRNGLFVEYCAKDFLDGTTQLSPMEELAYRRICDLIYASNNNLLDDDQSLAWSTKTGEAWPQIKVRLLEIGKIISDGQRLFNDRCNVVLAKTAKRIAQKSGAGKASAEAKKAKALINQETTSTAVGSDVATEEQRQTQRIQEPKNPPLDDCYSATPPLPHIAVTDEVMRIVGRTYDDHGWFGLMERVRQWIAAGWSPEGIIYPACRKYMTDHDGNPPPNRSYLEKVIQSFADNLAKPLPEIANVNGTRTRPAKPSLDDQIAELDRLCGDIPGPLEPFGDIAGGPVIDNPAQRH